VYLLLLFCSYFVVLCYFYSFVCTSVGLLPPGESPIAVDDDDDDDDESNNQQRLNMPCKACSIQAPVLGSLSNNLQ
jgi:hypothetical protein